MNQKNYVSPEDRSLDPSQFETGLWEQGLW